MVVSEIASGVMQPKENIRGRDVAVRQLVSEVSQDTLAPLRQAAKPVSLYLR